MEIMFGGITGAHFAERLSQRPGNKRNIEDLNDTDKARLMSTFPDRCAPSQPCSQQLQQQLLITAQSLLQRFRSSTPTASR